MSRPVPLTLEEARRRGQSSSHLDADPTYARRFVRRVSPLVSWAVVRWTPLAADGVTVASIACGVVGGVLVAVPHPAAYVGAVLLLQLAYLLDVADGEVARIRGTASKRGTYLDLIGHFVQNRALYAGASISLVASTGGAWWAIVVGLLVMGFATPFGLYARMQVVGSAPGSANPDHAPRIREERPRAASPGGIAAFVYRRMKFLWNYPASMNLFSLAIIVDALRLAAGSGAALAVPVLIVVFGLGLAVKQLAHAVRLVQRDDWT